MRGRNRAGQIRDKPAGNRGSADAVAKPQTKLR
jgi:hypothetical protein